MRLLLLLASSVAVTQAGTTTTTTTTTPPSASRIASSFLRDDRSLLSSLLQTAGYSETCVAASLDSCGANQQNSQQDALAEVMEQMGTAVKQVSMALTDWTSRPRHCKDLLDAGDSGSGLRQVYPDPKQPYYRVAVFCDHTVDGGGWTVLQRRANDVERQDFYRTYIEYQLGFGDLEGEFWLGLDLLHLLTSVQLQEMRVDLYDYESGHRWAKYGLFHVGAADTKYRLSVGRYSGNAEDSLISPHSGRSFTTHDADNDIWDQNCAQKFRGAWWYEKCHKANLNGYQYEGNITTYADGIIWHSWHGHHYSLRRTTMMVRPAF